MRRLASLLIVTCSAILHLSDHAIAQSNEKAGTASAVHLDTKAALVGRPPAVLRIGSDVFIGERITTDADGRSQLLFLSGLRLYIEPSSVVVVDGDSVDRRTATAQAAVSVLRGKIAISAPTGAVPYVEQTGGGQPSGVPAYERLTYQTFITTPEADGKSAVTADIRLPPPPQPPPGSPQTPGAIVSISHIEGRVEVRNLGFGRVDLLTSTGQTVTLRRPGFFVSFDPAKGLSAPARIPPAALTAGQPLYAGGPGVAGAGRAIAATADPPLGATSADTMGLSLATLDPRWLDIVGGFNTGQLGNVREQSFVADSVRSVLSVPFLPFLPATITTSSSSGTKNATASLGSGGQLLLSPAGQTIESLLGTSRPVSVTVQTSTITRHFVIP